MYAATWSVNQCLYSVKGTPMSTLACTAFTACKMHTNRHTAHGTRPANQRTSDSLSCGTLGTLIQSFVVAPDKQTNTLAGPCNGHERLARERLREGAEGKR